jgi:hypothetical protein
MENPDDTNFGAHKRAFPRESRKHDTVVDPARGQEPSDWDRGYGAPDYNQGYGPGYEPGYPGGREPAEYDRFRDSGEHEWPIPHARPSGEHAGRGPAAYRRPDNRILEDICERLAHHPAIDARDVEVSVSEGEVTLSGTVPDRTTKHAAEDLALETSGVKDLHNRLRVEAR